jgi:hypothetical protein
MHELLVVRDRGRLPMCTDGLTVDEDAVEPITARTLEPAQPNAHAPSSPAPGALHHVP